MVTTDTLRAESPSSSQFIWEDRRRLCSQGKLLHDYCSSQTVSRIYKYSNLAATVAIKINHIISLNNLHIRSNADISHTQSLETHRRCTTEKNLLLPEPLNKTNSGIRAYVNAAERSRYLGRHAMLLAGEERCVRVVPIFVHGGRLDQKRATL